MKGECITSDMSNQHLGNHIKVELLALIQGIRITIEKCLMPLEINIDYKELIGIIENDHPSYSNMIFYCRVLLRQLGDPPLLHDYRETNRVAMH